MKCVKFVTKIANNFFDEITSTNIVPILNWKFFFSFFRVLKSVKTLEILNTKQKKKCKSFAQHRSVKAFSSDLYTTFLEH